MILSPDNLRLRTLFFGCQNKVLANTTFNALFEAIFSKIELVLIIF